MSDMGRYGKVRFTLNLESSGDRLEGFAYGGGRGAMADGTFLAGVSRQMIWDTKV